MASRTRSFISVVFIPIIIGSIGLFDLTKKPRFMSFHTVDVLQLLATGMCYGVALAGLIMSLRKPRTE